MCVMLKRTYEIWDMDTEEILVDNLSFDDAAVQCKAYQDYFGNGIAVVIRETRYAQRKHTTPAQEFKSAWINYFGELQALGNLH